MTVLVTDACHLRHFIIISFHATIIDPSPIAKDLSGNPKLAVRMAKHCLDPTGNGSKRMSEKSETEKCPRES